MDKKTAADVELEYPHQTNQGLQNNADQGGPQNSKLFDQITLPPTRKKYQPLHRGLKKG